MQFRQSINPVRFVHATKTIALCVMCVSFIPVKIMYREILTEVLCK